MVAMVLSLENGKTRTGFALWILYFDGRKTFCNFYARIAPMTNS